jgi:hypothetical protein
LKPSLNLFGDFLEISAARGQAFASVRQEVASSRKKQGRRREFITSSVGLDCFSFGFLAQLIANFLYRRESTMMMLRLSLVAGLAGGTPLRQLLADSAHVHVGGERHLIWRCLENGGCG